MSSFTIYIPDYLRDIMSFNAVIIVYGILIIYLYDCILTYNKKKYRHLPDVLMKITSELIFDKKNLNSNDIKKLEQLNIKTNSRVRIIFVKILTQYSLFLKEDEDKTITKIYKSLDLHKDKIKDLSSFSKNKIIRALFELKNFNILVDRKYIIPLQKHKNKSIREVANSYTLKMYDEDIYDFLDFSNDSFTPWEQLEYFQLIINRTTLKKPHFKKWISPAYNATIVNIALDLCCYYYQDNAVESIHKMIKSADDQLRFNMITALGKLNHSSSIPILMELFEHEECTKCKREIIKSLGYMGYENKEIHQLLENALKTEKNINLRKALAISLQRTMSQSTIPAIDFETTKFNFQHIE